jgi:hypothetical protein
MSCPELAIIVSFRSMGWQALLVLHNSLLLRYLPPRDHHRVRVLRQTRGYDERGPLHCKSHSNSSALVFQHDIHYIATHMNPGHKRLQSYRLNTKPCRVKTQVSILRVSY